MGQVTIGSGDGSRGEPAHPQTSGGIDLWAQRFCVSARSRSACLLSADLGSAKAKAWGDAHDAGGNKLDNQMDLWNNRVGRLLGDHAHESSLPKEVLATILCRAAQQNGWLRRIGYSWRRDDFVLEPTT